MKKNSLLAEIFVGVLIAVHALFSGAADFLGDKKSYQYKPKKSHHF